MRIVLTNWNSQKTEGDTELALIHEDDFDILKGKVIRPGWLGIQGTDPFIGSEKLEGDV